MNDTRNTITNSEGEIGVLPRPNPDYFARVICSADCSNIYTEEVDDVAFGNMGGVSLLHMNLRSVEREREVGERNKSGSVLLR